MLKLRLRVLALMMLEYAFFIHCIPRNELLKENLSLHHDEKHLIRKTMKFVDLFAIARVEFHKLIIENLFA